MLIAFCATRADFESSDDVLVCGFGGVDGAGAEHSLILQRTPEHGPASEDWGVYVEFDDQFNSGYGLVLRCDLARERLSLILRSQLGRLEGVEGFEVQLAFGDATYEQIRTGLLHIFRGQPGTLVNA